MSVEILVGDCRERLRELPDGSVQCCVTSPPYFGLRDYKHDSQIGVEPTPDEFIAALVEVFREVRRVLRDDGVVWLNLGDSYARNPSKGTTGTPNGRNAAAQGYSGGAGIPSGVKEKDLIGIPWMAAFALRADGWYLRRDIIWHKPNSMPESVKDRCTTSHEYIFMLTKSARYHYDADAIAEPVSESMLQQMRQGYEGQSTKDYAESGAQDASASKRRIIEGKLKRSGNLERKARPDSPDSHTGNQAGSIPWEGVTRNKRSVWTIPTQPFGGAHFATFPSALIEPCILATCPAGGTVLDPFGGVGTTGLVAERLQRNAVLIELNPEYADIARDRLRAALCQVRSEAEETEHEAGPLFAAG